ncbi:MAG: Hsp20/alpha crystallin family protein [Balneolaceae bacterium]|nr:Hsp20/alpha crystallin family protein [Balneolaceae bacterium]
MKSLIRRPGSPIKELRREMDQLFDEMAPFSWFQEKEKGFKFWTPSTDMVETENEYVIQTELPGIAKEDVKINLQDNRLTISGERKKDENVQKQNFVRRERYDGSFMRFITLPSNVKEDKIKANYTDGVLTVTIQKSGKSKPKSVKIE